VWVVGAWKTCCSFPDRTCWRFADVDDQRAGRIYEKFPDVCRLRDYRRLLDEFGGQLDGLVISTRDCMHFYPAWAVMQLGLHVYLGKPLAHDLHETRMLTNEARQRSGDSAGAPAARIR